jgi:hypothetical protein
MGFLFTAPVGFLFTVTLAFLFTMTLGFQLTMSTAGAEHSYGPGGAAAEGASALREAKIGERPVEAV